MRTVNESRADKVCDVYVETKLEEEAAADF